MTHSEKLYDLTYFSELYEGDEEAIKSSIRIFVDTLPNDLALLQKGFNEKDWRTFFFAAHKLKTPVRYLRIGNMYDKFDRLVELTREGEYSPEIDIIYKQILPILKLAGYQLKKFVEE